VYLSNKGITQDNLIISGLVPTTVITLSIFYFPQISQSLFPADIADFFAYSADIILIHFKNFKDHLLFG